MQVFLVGGAVRDRLLGLPVRERDYVVVGATPEQMLELGYRQVGRDFPIFLHPQTKEEYALARTRRMSTAQKNAQPLPLADPGVSLEEDLARRDLTINAMAETEDGRLIDPFGGQQDLRERCLRHVSGAFADDPLRVLRVARFMARYQAFGFRVAPETLDLMREITASGLLEPIAPERVWQELMQALSLDDPEPFFLSLRACGALVRLFPEIDRLWGVPQPAKWHPEIDCGVHTMLAVKAACRLTEDLKVRFATLTHDLGKGDTPPEILPSHHGHEQRGARLVNRLCERLKAPKQFRFLARRCATYHGQCHRFDELRAGTVMKLYEGLKAFQEPKNLEDFLLVCEADYRGRKDFERRPYPQAERIRQLFVAAQQVRRKDLQTLASGAALGEILHAARVKAIKSAQKSLIQPAG